VLGIRPRPSKSFHNILATRTGDTAVSRPVATRDPAGPLATAAMPDSAQSVRSGIVVDQEGSDRRRRGRAGGLLGGLRQVQRWDAEPEGRPGGAPLLVDGPQPGNVVGALGRVIAASRAAGNESAADGDCL